MSWNVTDYPDPPAREDENRCARCRRVDWLSDEGLCPACEAEFDDIAMAEQMAAIEEDLAIERELAGQAA